MNLPFTSGNRETGGREPQDRINPDRLFAEQVHLVYRQAPIALLASIIIAMVVAFAFRDYFSHTHLFIWIVLNVLVTGIRYVFIHMYSFTAHSIHSERKWYRFFLITTLLSGVLWGVGGYVLFPVESMAHQAFLMLVIGGLAAGSVSTYSPANGLAASFFLPAALPLMVRFFSLEGETHFLMGGLLSFGMILMLFIARNVHRSTLELLRLRLKNEELVEVLSFANAQAEKLNLELKTEITDRIRIEQALRDSEEKFRGVVENAIDPIILTVDEKFIYVNQAGIELSGFSEEEIYNMEITEFLAVDENDREKFMEQYRKRLEQQDPHFQVETRVNTRDGRKVDILISNSLVRLGDRIGTIAIIKDVSEMKNVERELRMAKERAENATHLKDQFVSLVAHDLRSPLTSIFGILDLMLTDHREPLPSEKGKLIQTILESGKSLLASIEELLSLNRFHTGRLHPLRKHFLIRDAAQEQINLLAYLAREKNIRVSNDLPGERRLFADRQLFGKVIQNLVSNGIKFGSSGTRIGIKLVEGEGLTLAVEDNGPGITPDLARHLFDPEVLTTTTGTAGEQGHGRGLPFCNEIMKAHGGQILVESEPGQGTIFYLQFPLVEPEIMLAGKRETIAEVDRINNGTFSMTPVEDAELVIKALSRSEYHLVIICGEFIKRDGFSLIRSIRQNPETMHIPVVLLLRNRDSDTMENAIQNGVNEIMVFPENTGELEKRLNRHLS